MFHCIVTCQFAPALSWSFPTAPSPRNPHTMVNHWSKSEGATCRLTEEEPVLTYVPVLWALGRQSPRRAYTSDAKQREDTTWHAVSCSFRCVQVQRYLRSSFNMVSLHYILGNISQWGLSSILSSPFWRTGTLCSPHELFGFPWHTFMRPSYNVTLHSNHVAEAFVMQAP